MVSMSSSEDNDDAKRIHNTHMYIIIIIMFYMSNHDIHI